MACQACVQIPLDAHARFMQKIRRPKDINKTRVRIVYVAPKLDMKLLIDGDIPDTTNGSYFSIDIGLKYVSLRDRKGEIPTHEEFIFDKDKNYTLIVRGKNIYQLEDYIVCPESGTARLQAYNLNNKSIDIYLDEELVYENLNPQESFEIILDENLYEVRVDPDLSPALEVELKSPIIYTVFFTPSASFVVENPYCNNLV